MFDRESSVSCPSALLDRIGESWRAQNRGAAAALSAIGELFAHRLKRSTESEDWAVDTEASVSAEVAAELRMSQGLAASQLRYARAMRERLPRVGEVFLTGYIDQRTFATIVYRTDLIEDPDILAIVDGRLAAGVLRWPSMSRGRLSGLVDKVIARADIDAVRRRSERRDGREVWFSDLGDGLSEIHGSLLSPDAHALDKRLTAMAGTVCERDPRSRDQRRADALAALAVGADRLTCHCDDPACTAEKRSAATPVVIHVIADQAAVDGVPTLSEARADGLIAPEFLAELAAGATVLPLIHPADAAPENHYTPSKKLADFVRCRDLTCRWPGCDRPAFDCDVDHTIPYGDGGPTHASNLKCYCRAHHLVKTFWGWHDQQLPDGTIILTSPAGRTYVTTPGGGLLFPGLCVPTGEAPPPVPEAPLDDCTDRTAMMPRRRRSRQQDRARRVAAERQQNHATRAARRARSLSWLAPAPPGPDDDPPPF